jgi:pyruvate dehydrogenase E2 component (dihydrolipoamide acetyltransferase)
MAIEILMPRLSDTMEEGKILKWLKKVGDQIEIGDIIAEVETDKADMEIEALDAGVLSEIRVQEGESVAVNGVIAVLSEDGAVVVSTPTARKTENGKPSAPPTSIRKEVEEKPQSVNVQPNVERPTADSAGRQSVAPPERKVRELREPRPRRDTTEVEPTEHRLLTSPLVRRMAQDQGIDLSQVRGSGPGGRIVKQDVEAYTKGQPVAPSQTQGQAPPEPVSPPVTQPAVALTTRKEPFSRMRATIAKRMAESMREIPHFYVTTEIDMSEAVRLRAALKASDRVSADVTYTHFLIKAIAIALQRHPRLNASFAEDGREFKADINIGIAVSLDDGLIVPVLHHCGTLSLLEIATQANALVERARTNKPKPEDLQGGTFTISNMGMLPVEHFTAIINPPQGAILAVGAIKERPVARNGAVHVAHTMMVTLSCDHRILDGVTGGQFLAELKKLLENPVGLMV